jgi:hypothetical protein
LREPTGPRGRAEELATLELQPGGDLILRAVAVGLAVERPEGEGRNKRMNCSTVRADDVPGGSRRAVA